MTRKLVLAVAATMLVGVVQADSIKGQENAEIAYCMVETNTMSGRTNKIARDRHRACLKEHGWLPNSGAADILPPTYIESANAAFAKADAKLAARRRCHDIAGDQEPSDVLGFNESYRRYRIFAACMSASGL
jgi:hypothetical protein